MNQFRQNADTSMPPSRYERAMDVVVAVAIAALLTLLAVVELTS